MTAPNWIYKSLYIILLIIFLLGFIFSILASDWVWAVACLWVIAIDGLALYYTFKNKN